MACQHRLAQTKFTLITIYPQLGDLERIFKACETSLTELNIASSWVTSGLPREVPCWQNTASLMKAGLGELLQLKTLDLSGHDIIDADCLKSLTGLTNLSLQYCSLNPNFGVATALCSLTSLDISNNPKVYNIDSLAGLTGLTKLDVSWCGLLNVSKPLACQLSLTSLNVSNNPKLRNIDCLTGLTGLTELGVACCGLDDISKPLASLASLPRLTSLNLSNNKEISLTALTCLTGLAKLNISGCGKLRL